MTCSHPLAPQAYNNSPSHGTCTACSHSRRLQSASAALSPQLVCCLYLLFLTAPAHLHMACSQSPNNNPPVHFGRLPIASVTISQWHAMAEFISSYIAKRSPTMATRLKLPQPYLTNAASIHASMRLRTVLALLMANCSGGRDCTTKFSPLPPFLVCLLQEMV